MLTRPRRLVSNRPRTAWLLAAMLLMAVGVAANSATVAIPVKTADVGFDSELNVTVEGEFDSVAWEVNPVAPNEPLRLILRARKGKFSIGRTGITATIAEGREGEIESFDPEFMIDTSGRLTAIRLNTQLRRSGGSDARALPETRIKVVMELAYMQYVPIDVSGSNGRRLSPAGPGLDSYAFDVRLDATGTPKDVRWLFMRYEVYDHLGRPLIFSSAAGGAALVAQFATLFDEPQKKNTVLVRPALEVHLAAAGAAKPLLVRGVVVGMDSDGLLIVQPVEVQLPA